MDQFELWRKAKICKNCPWNLLQYSPSEGKHCDLQQIPLECSYIQINNMISNNGEYIKVMYENVDG